MKITEHPQKMEDHIVEGYFEHIGVPPECYPILNLLNMELEKISPNYRIFSIGMKWGHVMFNFHLDSFGDQTSQNTALVLISFASQYIEKVIFGREVDSPE